MYQETYTAASVLAAIADTFVSTDHEDWLRYDNCEGTLRLGNLKVAVRGNKLIWRDMGLPRNAGEAEIPDGTKEDEELPDGSCISDIVDEVGQWLLTWTDDIHTGVVLDELHDRFGGGVYKDSHGDPVIIEPDGVSVWGVSIFDDSLHVWACRGSVSDYRPDGTVEVLWEASYPIDPEMIVCGYMLDAVDEALRELEEGC